MYISATEIQLKIKNLLKLSFRGDSYFFSFAREYKNISIFQNADSKFRHQYAGTENSMEQNIFNCDCNN